MEFDIGYSLIEGSPLWFIFRNLDTKIVLTLGCDSKLEYYILPGNTLFILVESKCISTNLYKIRVDLRLLHDCKSTNFIAEGMSHIKFTDMVRDTVIDILHEMNNNYLNIWNSALIKYPAYQLALSASFINHRYTIASENVMRWKGFEGNIINSKTKKHSLDYKLSYRGTELVTLELYNDIHLKIEAIMLAHLSTDQMHGLLIEDLPRNKSARNTHSKVCIA